MKKILSVCACMAVIFLSGCAWSEIDKNLTNAAQLRCGMSKEQVIALMGEPLKDQFFASENKWHYRDQVRRYDGQCTADECMVLVFEDDKLIGWGKAFNTARNFTELKK